MSSPSDEYYGGQPPPNQPVGRRAAVTAVLVSHDGARWLPAVLSGIASQSVRPDYTLAVDTGSKDESVQLLTDSLGHGAVIQEKLTTSFPKALRRGVAEAPDSEWIWILHDDSNPEPRALENLLAVAALDPKVDILGPKLREWPSLRRLLELGVTISGTGRRETGLELGEYDQGQHDEIRSVLAVNTAGMLVRRSVLKELGGFDNRLPIFGNDVDFGWRAARAGHKTLIVPDAVVFHAEAAHRGLRKTALTGRHTHLAERTAALYTLLANCTAAMLPVQLVRLFFGSLLRVLGFLAVRSPGEAVDELAAVLSVYLKPGTIFAARRARSPLASNDARVRGLLAPRWLPYRHGLDFVGDLVAAATDQAADVAERRRAAKMAERGEVAAAHRDEDEMAEDTGIVVRFLTNPVAMLMTGFVLVALWLGHQAFGAGALSGPGLSPVPEHAADLWRLHVESWHPLTQGSGVSAPPYVLPMALLASLMFGHPGGALAAILVLSVPFATWGAWRFLRVIGRLADPRGLSKILLIWGSVTYGLVPIVSGAWAQGRFGVVASAALLPWFAHAVLGFADPTSDRRWRAAWRASLLLMLITAFTPVAWVYVLFATGLVLGLGYRFARGLVTDRSIWLPLVTPVLATPVLLLPWFLTTVVGGHPQALLFEVGRLPGPLAGAVDVMSGRFEGTAAPHWMGLLLGLLALVVLLMPEGRMPIVVAWVVAGVAAVLLGLLSHLSLPVAVGHARIGPGFLVVVIQAAAVTGVALGLGRMLSGRGRIRQFGGLAALAMAVVVPLAGLGWALASGDSDLKEDADTAIPAYMTQNAELAPDRGVLVIGGTVRDGITWTVQRGDGVTFGEDEILAFTEPDANLTETVSSLISRPTPEVIDSLAKQGIEYVVLPAPADAQVAAGLDATAGLAQASAANPQTRAWHLVPAPSGDFVAGHGAWWRWLLVAIQVFAILSVAVLSGPTTRREAR